MSCETLRAGEWKDREAVDPVVCTGNHRPDVERAGSWPAHVYMKVLVRSHWNKEYFTSERHMALYFRTSQTAPEKDWT